MNRRLSNLIIRLGLGLTVLYAGLANLIFKFYKPPVAKVFPFISNNTGIIILGIIQIILAVLLLIGLFTKLASSISALMYLGFIISGLTLNLFNKAYLYKDIALLAVSIALAIEGCKYLGLDRKLFY